MRIIVHSEDELLEVARKLLHCGTNLRYWTKQWNEKHGGLLLQRKQYWEKKWDELMEELEARRSNLLTEVKIEIKDTDNS